MNQIVADVSRHQTRIAVLEQGQPVELLVEKSSDSSTIGNIYSGVIDNILPGIAAAFVDLGLIKKAYMNLTEGWESLRVGQRIVVQIEKEAIDTKGPRVTGKLSVSGRFSALFPRQHHVALSKRIEDSSERNRLKKLGESLCPQNMGMVIRTNAEGCTEEEFTRDVAFVSSIWKSIEVKIDKSETKGLIHKNFDLISTALRDLLKEGTECFLINHKPTYENAVELMGIIFPEFQNKVRLYDKNMPIFTYYKIDEMIDKAIDRKVSLESGGNIYIDRTEAMTCIDVNTGSFVGTNRTEDTIVRTNTEAAREIARQLRLRDMGGIIIIDFIDMAKESHRDSILKVLTNCCMEDRTRTKVLGFTRLGLVEVVRKKERQRVEDILNEDCPYCMGKGKVPSVESMADRIEKDLYAVIPRKDIRAIEIKMSGDIAHYFDLNNGNKIKLLEGEINKKIKITAEPTLLRENYEITPLF